MALIFENIEDAGPAMGESILAAVALLEARKTERLAKWAGVILLVIGSLVAFTDAPPMIVLGCLTLVGFLMLLAAAEIHWRALEIHLERAEALRLQEGEQR